MQRTFFSISLSGLLTTGILMLPISASLGSQPSDFEYFKIAFHETAAHHYTDAAAAYEKSGPTSFIRHLGFEGGPDQQFFTREFAKYETHKIPSVAVKGGVIEMTYKGKSVSFELVNYETNTILINGNPYNFVVGKTLEESFNLNGQAIYKLMGGESPKSSRFSLINEAQALGTWGWVGAIGLMGLVAVPFITSLFDKKEGNAFEKTGRRYKAFGKGVKKGVWDGKGFKEVWDGVKGLAGSGKNFKEVEEEAIKKH